MDEAFEFLIDLAFESAERFIPDESCNFVEGWKKSGKEVSLDCPDCKEKMKYLIGKEQVEKLRQGQSVEVITTCIFCKETFKGLVRKRLSDKS